MSNWEKTMRKERFQQVRKNPSFSSTLLDEIYRSIDDSDEKQDDLGVKKTQSNACLKSEISSFRRTCLVEQWMDKKVSENIVPRRRQNSPESNKKSVYENDNALFFSSSSSGSDSSSGEFSSETESFARGKVMGSTCFSYSRPKPKPIRTSVSVKSPETVKAGDSPFFKKQSKTQIFDQYHYNSKENEEIENSLKSSKLRALKIYNNLKKIKQPISPGGRLTTFLNSIFTSGNAKKTKDSKQNIGFDEIGTDKRSKSTCSSASSFSRSFLNKTPTGVIKTVTFNPDRQYKDELYRPQDQKSINHKKLCQSSTPICPKSLNHSALQENKEPEFQRIEINRPTNEALKRYDLAKLRGNMRVSNNDFVGNYDDGDDDAASDSSSDLFEIDNLEFIGRNCEELPVYATTDVFTNRAIY